MNPICFKVPRLVEETVRVETWDLPHFYNEVHFHEECQLTYILQGEGILWVGDKSEEFSTGDLILIGKNTPHVLLHEKDYYENSDRIRARAITIFFSKDTFQEIFTMIPESSRIEEFLEKSQFGIRIQHTEDRKLRRYLNQMIKLRNVSKVLLFMKILDLISHSMKVELISTNLPYLAGKEDGEKLNRVFTHIVSNYDKRITLKEVAALVNLTPTAFCRFFKMRTNNTFSRFLIEVRINEACKMLSTGNHNVTETLNSCGYNNSSNFLRHFRQHTGVTPSEYKEKLMNPHREFTLA